MYTQDQLKADITLDVRSSSFYNIATACKKSRCILSERSDFLMINSSSHLRWHMLTSLSLDEILLPRYVTLSIISDGCHLKLK